MKLFSLYLVICCLCLSSARPSLFFGRQARGTVVESHDIFDITNVVDIRGGGSEASANPLGAFARIIRDSRRDLVAAAVARSTSIFTMYPVDTMKTRLQMEQANAFRMEGVYKGVSGSLLGQVPYG
jgi:hypothetical protein